MSSRSSSGRRCPAANSRLLRTVIQGNTDPRCAISTARGLGRSTARPSITTSPRSGRSNPDNTWSSVDLPQPDGPTIETNSPSAISRLTSSIAESLPATSGYDFQTLRIATLTVMRGQDTRVQQRNNTAALLTLLRDLVSNSGAAPAARGRKFPAAVGVEVEHRVVESVDAVAVAEHDRGDRRGREQPQRARYLFG